MARGTRELINLASGARLAQGVERVRECADSDEEPRDAKVHQPLPDLLGEQATYPLHAGRGRLISRVNLQLAWNPVQ